METTNWHEPATITQGETVKFTRELPDYPAGDGWSLEYSIRGQGQVLSFTSTASGNNHSVTIAATTTATWLPAAYAMQGFAVKSGEKHQIYLSGLTITPNLSTAAGDLDMRTHAEKMLALVEQQLEECAKNILLSTTVEGTTILRERRNELLMLRQRYIQERRGEIARDAAKSGRPSPRKIQSRMNITAGGNAFAFGSGNSVFNFPNP